jgi:hypothetical protein
MKQLIAMDYTKEEEIFNDFRKAYPGTKRGNYTEFYNFQIKHKDWKEVLSTLLPLLKEQERIKEKKRELQMFVPYPKNLQTYINQRCWEEEIPEPKEQQKHEEGKFS